ncbi:hypothetical protein N7474_000302 [Penicillium riverlandense]|uniref:uncharacterized protein n=1 Tax=Penicillium riverlandense TaxID=1903569 RepID=UPI0025483755|nr:uncharacterized protein N7474_000302 [Penicillium riverlandense]KAJ5831991.1 hypothetical protein N7474_000302 [Penicillium riverlandense]
MATATKIHLSPPTDAGVYSSGVREDGARAASEVLQEDMAAHHVFFNNEGFHNHIVHLILSIYALGAGPAEIKAAYKRNASYQRPVFPTDTNRVQAMRDTATFMQCLGKEENYSNFLAFFQQEINAKGVGDVLKEYIFKGDERAESMLSRLPGLIHPLIHLGFGLEFNQPAIVAQALSQAAVHDDWIGRAFFLPAEKMANSTATPGQKSLLEILGEIRADKALTESVQWGDANKIRDGVLTRAPERMLSYAAKYRVAGDRMNEALADMINTVVYYTSAAQRPTKEIRIDFFYIHCVNSTIFFSKIIDLPFLDEAAKVRMLEWKGRLDLLMYVSRGAPDLLPSEVTKYPAKDDWATVFSRSITHPGDDGHLAKLARAVAHGQRVCQPFESQQKMPISGDMWLKIGNMAVDSTIAEDERPMWIRSTGFDEAWARFKGRANNL